MLTFANYRRLLLRTQMVKLSRNTNCLRINTLRKSNHMGKEAAFGRGFLVRSQGWGRRVTMDLQNWARFVKV